MKTPYVLVFVFALCAAPAMAHHSRANYDSNQPIEFKGTVTRLEWKNPHVYVYLERIGPDGKKEEWMAELGSIQNLKQIGISETDLKTGDVGTISAIRDRDPNKHLLMWRNFTKADGTRLGRAPGARGTGDTAELTAQRGPGSKDFTGVWGVARGGGGRGNLERYPLTEKGKVSLETYRKEGEEGDPILNCEKHGVPRTIYAAYALEIKREPNVVHLDWEYNEVHRPVYLNQKTHPADGPRTHQGHSFGWFEGETLVVDTANFAPQKWGNGIGLDSSDQKRVVERYTLEDGGHAMRVEYTVTDPVYLSKPVTEVVRFQERPGYVVSEWKCDVAASRKHLLK